MRIDYVLFLLVVSTAPVHAAPSLPKEANLEIKVPEAGFTVTLNGYAFPLPLITVSARLSKESSEEKIQEVKNRQFQVEFPANSQKKSVFKSILDKFAVNEHPFELRIESKSGDWTEGFMDAASDFGLKANMTMIKYGNDRPPTEKRLLKFIKDMQVQSFELEDSKPWNVNDDFFKDSTVKGLLGLHLSQATKSAITDASLSGFEKATSISLGQASKITLEGIRKFFQPVFTGLTSQRTVALKPSFNFDEKLLLENHGNFKEGKPNGSKRQWFDRRGASLSKPVVIFYEPNIVEGAKFGAALSFGI